VWDWSGDFNFPPFSFLPEFTLSPVLLQMEGFLRF